MITRQQSDNSVKVLGTIIPEAIVTNSQYEFLFLNYHEMAMGPIVAYVRYI